MGFHRTYWRVLMGVAVVLAFGAAKPDPQLAFAPGHYRLADGVQRAGQLCLVNDNLLLVRDADTSRVRELAAAQVRNFVIGAESFTVLRNFDILLNGVVTHYTHGMAQVCLSKSGIELYRLKGPMEVLKNVPNAAVLNAASFGLRYGLVGAAAGYATGRMTAGDTSPVYKQQTVTVYLLRQVGVSGLQTIQPNTTAGRKTVEQALADNERLRKKARRVLLTEDNILAMFREYAAGKKS